MVRVTVKFEEKLNMMRITLTYRLGTLTAMAVHAWAAAVLRTDVTFARSFGGTPNVGSS